jgi:hypothetical protein
MSDPPHPAGDLEAVLKPPDTPEAQRRRVVSLTHEIAAQPGLKLLAQLQALTESTELPLEPWHRERLVDALKKFRDRVDILIDMIEETR